MADIRGPGIPRSLIFRTSRDVSRDGKTSLGHRLPLENEKISSRVTFTMHREVVTCESHNRSIDLVSEIKTAE
jgi:hypothetical protein